MFPLLGIADAADQAEHMGQYTVFVSLFFHKTESVPVAILHPVF